MCVTNKSAPTKQTLEPTLRMEISWMLCYLSAFSTLDVKPSTQVIPRFPSFDTQNTILVIY